MTAWALCILPATLLLLVALLELTVAMERRILSPQSVILRVTRARRATPEYAELLVTTEVARLLQEAPAGR